MTEIRCPMCGHQNPEGSINCEKCDARIVPMGTLGQSKAAPEDSTTNEQDDLNLLLDDIVDEGAAQNTGDLDSEILSWLDEDQPERKGDLPDAEEDQEQTIPVEDRLSSLLDEIEEPVDEKEITDWLESQVDEEGLQEEGDEDWLAIASEDLEEADEADEEEPLPDWMADTVADVSSLLEEPAIEDDESGVPDWMGDTISVHSQEEKQEPDAEGPLSPDLPEWIADTPRVTTGELDDSVLEEEEEELPEWFTQELAEETPSTVESESKAEPEVPDWIADTPRVTTGELDDSVLDETEEELPEWFTQELDEDVVEESLTTGSLPEKVSTGALPWMDGVSDEEDQPPEPPQEKPKKQVFMTEGLDPSAVEEPPRDSLKPDEKLPPSSGMLDGKRVKTGELPWMDGVSDEESSEEDEEFELPISKPLKDDEDQKKRRSSGLLRKVTTSMLPWMSGVSDEEDKPADQPPESRQSTILERFSGLLGRKEPEPEPEETELEIELPEEPPAEVVSGESTSPDDLEPPALEEETTEEAVLAEEPQAIAEEEPPIDKDTIQAGSEPVSVEELIQEEKIQTVEPPPKERYEDALPEKEKAADSWDEFMESSELEKDSDELPDWFAQTTEAKSSSDLLKQIGADENPTPVPVEEPEEEETPKKKRGLTLGFLKRLRKSTDEDLGEDSAKEEVKDEETMAEEDWDLAQVLGDSKPLEDETEETVPEDILREDWVIEDSASEDAEEESVEEIPASFIESLEESPDETTEETETEEKPRQSLLERTANLAGDTGKLEEESDLSPEDESLIGFAGTSELPSWMVKGGKKSKDTSDLVKEAIGEEDQQDEVEETEEIEEEPAMTADLPDWMNTGKLPEPEELSFEVDDELMDSINEAVPTSELPDWLEEAEDKFAEEFTAIEEAEGEEPEETEQPSEETAGEEDLALESLFEEIESGEEEQPIEDLMDGFFEEPEVEEDIEEIQAGDTTLAAILEEGEREEEETKDVTSALAEAGLPKFLDDDIDLEEEDIEEEPQEDEIDLVSISQHLPKYLDDDIEMEPEAEDLLEQEPSQAAEDEEELVTTADLPEWMTETEEGEPEQTVEADIEPHIEEAPEEATAVLPEWMEELPEEEVTEPEEEKASTSTLEDWMKDPTATHGLTGMLLDELSTGTLPPLEDEEEEATAVLPEWMSDLAEENLEEIEPQYLEESGEEEKPEEPETEQPLEEVTEKPVTSALDDWIADPSATHGLTGALLDSLDTGTLPPMEDVDAEETEEAQDLPDWLSEDVFETPEESIDIESPESGIAATAPMGDIAATHALPDWMSEEEAEEERIEEEIQVSDEIPVDLADFISSDEDLPDWMDEVAADEPEEQAEDVEFTSAFEADQQKSSSDQTAVMPDWVEDMGTVRGQTSQLIDSLETEDTKALQVPGSTSELPDWLSEYSEEEGEPATQSQADIEAWLAAQDEDEESVEEDDGLEPVIAVDTGELNQFINEEGIQPEGEQLEDVDIEDVVNIEVEKQLPDWVLDLEPDETAPMSPEPVAAGTAGLPEWLVSEDGEPDIDMTEEEIPPMDSALFDFMKEEGEDAEQAPAPVSMEAEADEDFDEDLDDEAFDISSLRDNLAKDSLFGAPADEGGEEVTPADLYQATVGKDFSSEDLSEGGEEVSPYDIHALEDVEDRYTPSMNLEQQTAWLEDYAEPEEETTTEDVSASPFSISLDEAEAAMDDGVAMADELPDWVDEVETLEEGEDDIWDRPLAAMAAISSSVQEAFDQEQPELQNERANIQLMERILLSEKGSVQTTRPRRRTRELNLRLMLTLLLAVAVFAGLFTMAIPLPNFITNAPVPVVQFHDQINFFTTNLRDQPALVVFDYQPAYHEELSVYAELPLRTLMANDARLFTFSTVPEGPALSQKMLFDIVIRNGLQYNTQSQAVPLGYLPGGSNAIRDFSIRMRSTVHGLDVGSSGTYVWDLPTVTDVDSIDDFAMVIVLTDDLDKARLWIEQATLYLPETTPLMMVTSSRITPMLKPYLLSDQLNGLVGSAIDTAAYGTLANQDGTFRYYWRAYQLGIYLMGFAIIAGAILQISRHLSKALKRGNS